MRASDGKNYLTDVTDTEQHNLTPEGIAVIESKA